MNKTLYYLLITMLFASCEEEISSVTLQSQAVVVSGYLYADRPIDSIRITKSIDYSGTGKLEVIDSLSIIVNDGTNDILLENIGNGYYRNLNYKVKYETAYTMKFLYKNIEISSKTYVQSPVEISLSQDSVYLERIEFSGGGPGFPGNMEQQIVDITWINKNADYYFVVVENIEDEPDYVNEIFEQFGSGLPGRLFRSEPEIIDQYSINSQRELQTYGTYEIIVYRINAEYAALYETVGSSTLSIKEPPSNIINGVGIFTGVTPHVMYLEVLEK